LPSGNTEESPVAGILSGLDKTVRVLDALADKSRLQILDCIRNGATNPGEMSNRLKRHRSTIEKHLRILLKANIVEKVPSLRSGGQLSVRYEIRENVRNSLAIILDQCKTFEL
jgi:DNA-binding transcriptional ArsR family regulator